MNNQEYVIISYLSDCGIWMILTCIGSTVVSSVSTRQPTGLPAAMEVTRVVAVTTVVEANPADTVRLVLLCWGILVH